MQVMSLYWSENICLQKFLSSDHALVETVSYDCAWFSHCKKHSICMMTQQGLQLMANLGLTQIEPVA
jgi:hypothetical protein